MKTKLITDTFGNQHELKVDDDMEWIFEYSIIASWNGQDLRPSLGNGSFYSQIIHCPSHLSIDHKDRDTFNCQRDNLRIADKTQQQLNRGLEANGKMFIGVVQRSQYSYAAEFTFKCKKHRLCGFKSPMDAAFARDQMAYDLLVNMPIPKGCDEPYINYVVWNFPELVGKLVGGHQFDRQTRNNK